MGTGVASARGGVSGIGTGGNSASGSRRAGPRSWRRFERLLVQHRKRDDGNEPNEPSASRTADCSNHRSTGAPGGACGGVGATTVAPDARSTTTQRGQARRYDQRRHEAWASGNATDAGRRAWGRDSYARKDRQHLRTERTDHSQGEAGSTDGIRVVVKVLEAEGGIVTDIAVDEARAD